MYEDALEIILRARATLTAAEEYFDSINKQFILEYLNLSKFPCETKKKSKKENFKEKHLYWLGIFNPKLAEEIKKEKAVERKAEIDCFENEIQTSSMILSFLSHKMRMLYFTEALKNDLRTVNIHWFDIISKKYSPYGTRPLNYQIK